MPEVWADLLDESQPRQSVQYLIAHAPLLTPIWASVNLLPSAPDGAWLTGDRIWPHDGASAERIDKDVLPLLERGQSRQAARAFAHAKVEKPLPPCGCHLMGGIGDARVWARRPSAQERWSTRACPRRSVVRTVGGPPTLKEATCLEAACGERLETASSAHGRDAHAERRTRMARPRWGRVSRRVPHMRVDGCSHSMTFWVLVGDHRFPPTASCLRTAVAIVAESAPWSTEGKKRSHDRLAAFQAPLSRHS